MTKPNNQSDRDQLPYAVWEFNYKPEKYVHASWLKDLPNADVLMQLIKEDKRQTATRLSHHLLSQLGFNGKFFFDFSDSLTQLALWDAEDLHQLVKLVGVMFYFDDIRQKITRREVIMCRKSLGDYVYHFALEEAHQIKANQLKTVKIPERVDFMRKLEISGMAAVYTAMKDYPPALVKRLMVKLPKDLFDDYVRFVARQQDVPGGTIGNADLTKKLMDYMKVEVNVG